MKHPTFTRKNGTSTHYPKKEKISLKKEWHTAEDRVFRFINWLKGGE